MPKKSLTEYYNPFPYVNRHLESLDATKKKEHEDAKKEVKRKSWKDYAADYVGGTFDAVGSYLRGTKKGR